MSEPKQQERGLMKIKFTCPSCQTLLNVLLNIGLPDRAKTEKEIQLRGFGVSLEVKDIEQEK